MGPTQISVAIIMVGVAVAILVWFQSSQAAASGRRMMGMMTHVSLIAGSATFDDPRTMAIRQEARRRCMRCPREDATGGSPERSKGTTPFAPTRRPSEFLREPACAPIDRQRVGAAVGVKAS